MAYTEEEVEARIKAAVEISAIDFLSRGGFSKTEMFYLSFADPNRPTGTQWLGGCYIRAESFEEAWTLSKIMDIDPGGEVEGGGPFPAAILIKEYEHRLLTTKEELDKAIDLVKLQEIRNDNSSAIH